MPRPDGGSRRGEGILLVVSLVVFGVVAIGLGYLLGEYALKSLMKPQTKPGPDIQAVSEGGLPAGSPAAGAAQKAAGAQGTGSAAENGSSMPGTQGSGASGQADTGAGGVYRVQVGAFNEKGNAEGMAESLRAEGYTVYVTGTQPYRVQVGAFEKKENAESLAKELKDKGYEVYVAK